jgi:hypothetical protein
VSLVEPKPTVQSVPVTTDEPGMSAPKVIAEPVQPVTSIVLALMIWAVTLIVVAAPLTGRDPRYANATASSARAVTIVRGAVPRVRTWY